MNYKPLNEGTEEISWINIRIVAVTWILAFIPQPGCILLLCSLKFPCTKISSLTCLPTVPTCLPIINFSPIITLSSAYTSVSVCLFTTVLLGRPPQLCSQSQSPQFLENPSKAACYLGLPRPKAAFIHLFLFYLYNLSSPPALPRGNSGRLTTLKDKNYINRNNQTPFLTTLSPFHSE